MMRTCFIALWSHWKRNPVQLFAYIAGLALATALWSGVQAINAEARASYDAAAGTLGEGQYDQIVPRSGDRIPLNTYVALRLAGWQVSPVMEGRIARVRVVGVDPVTSPDGLAGAAPLDQQAGDAANQDAQLFATAETAELLGDAAVVAVDENTAPGVAVGDIAQVAALLGRDDLSRLIVLSDQPIGTPPLSEIAPQLQQIASSQTADIAALTDSFHLNLTAFGLLSFVVGLFIVHSTIGLAFEQRRGMIRTLRSLGVSLRMLVSLIAVEMLALALVGAALGIMLGYIIAAVLLPDVAASLRGLYGAQVSGTLALRPEWWLSGFGLALLGAVLALAGRLWQISKMPLLASVMPRAWALASGARLRVQALLSVGLLAIAAVLAALADGLITGFALLGFLLLGVALAFPVLAHGITIRFQRSVTSPFWSWFWADTRQQLPGLSLALMALLLAVSANIGVATMVSSFRLTFIGFLDQRLAAELYVQTESAAQSDQLESYLAARGLESLPVTNTEISIEGRPVELTGLRVSATHRDNWGFLAAMPNVWEAVAADDALILNEQYARRADIWVGDSIEIAQGVLLPIAGIVGDYGNPKGQAFVSETLFATLHPASFATQFGVRTDNPSALRAEITRDIGVPARAMIDQASVKAMSIDVFERTFLVTAALNVLTLGVAGFAILMSLLTLADLRIPQLAPVWAIGLTRRRLGLLELLRAVALASLVFLFALPVGIALAWVLLAIVNVAAFGWKLPMFLFPSEYGMLGGYALLAAFLAALWPVSRLVRTPPSRLLKVFSNAT
ncbi:MAG: FtsX-like permease family protein [Pseudomonadota bacterium]